METLQSLIRRLFDAIQDRYWLVVLAYLALHVALNVSRTPFWRHLLG